jgi:hypothetical protein
MRSSTRFRNSRRVARARKTAAGSGRLRFERYEPRLALTSPATAEGIVHQDQPLTGAYVGGLGNDSYIGVGSLDSITSVSHAIRDAQITDPAGDDAVVATNGTGGYVAYGVSSTSITLGDGAASLDVSLTAGMYARGIAAGSLTMGSGNSTVTIRAVDGGTAAEPSFYYYVAGVENWQLRAGDGADRLNITVDAVKPETFRSYGIVTGDIDLGRGDDDVTIDIRNRSGTQESIAVDAKSKIDLGDGDNRFTALSTGYGIVDSSLVAGDGNDWIDVTSNRESARNSNIETGLGDDTVFLRCSSGNHPDLAASTVKLGEGDDYLDCGSAVASMVDGGTGFDILRLRGDGTAYTTTPQADGSTLITRPGDDLFSLRIRDIELVLYANLVSLPAHAGAPLAGYLTGSPESNDLYYGRGLGVAIDSLRLVDRGGADQAVAIGEGGYVSSGILNSDFTFGDQNVSLSSTVLGGLYCRPVFGGRLQSGSGSTNVCLTAIEPTASTAAIYYYAAGAENWTCDVGEGHDMLDVDVVVNRPDQVRGYGMTASRVTMGRGDDAVLVTVENTSGFRYAWGLKDMPSVDLGDGADVMSIASVGVGIETTSVDAAHGDDFVAVAANLSALKQSLLALGDGKDRVFLRTSDASLPTVDGSTVDMGDGDDDLIVGGWCAGAVLDGGVGTDRLRMAGKEADYTVAVQPDGDWRLTSVDNSNAAWIARNFESLVFDDSVSLGDAEYGIRGTGRVFEPLSVERTAADPDGVPGDGISCRWQWSGDGVNWTNVGRGPTFLPHPNQVGGNIRALVSYVDNTGAVSRVETVPSMTIATGSASDPTPEIPTPRPSENVLRPASSDDRVSISGTGYTAVEGNDAPNNIAGNDFGNLLSGGGGADVITGGDNTDVLYGGAGDDYADGGAGEDIFIGGSGPGNDVYVGGAGIDVVKYTSAHRPVVVDLSAGAATGLDIDSDTLRGIENAIGGQGDDVISGSDGSNDLWGYSGNDTLVGRGGDDGLYGDDGDDSLSGLDGNDRVDGGRGNDLVIFRGRRDEYHVQATDGGGFRIRDTVAGRDGWDLVSNVELYRFGDWVTSSPLSYPNRSPTDIGLSSLSISENQPAGTVVGTFSTTDADAADAFTYALVAGTGSDGNATFAIQGGRLVTSSAFDYESQKSYSVRIRSMDQGQLSVEKVFTINVIDLPETPVTWRSGSPLGSITTTYGTASTPTATTIAGAFLTGVVTATAPAGFEVTSDGVSYGATASFAVTAGVLGATVRVRLSATSSAGTYSGNVVVSGGSAPQLLLPIPVGTVAKKALTVAGLSAQSKTYDGTATATLLGKASLFGKIGVDDVTLNGVAAAKFSVNKAGVGRVVNVEGLSLSGTAARNYTLTPLAVAANILPRQLVVRADDKTRVRGVASPPFTASITGFAGGETAATALTGQPLLSTTATTSSPRGVYSVMVSSGTLAARDDNYTFSFVPGSLSIIASPVALTGFAATPGNRQVALSWSAPADNGGAPITNYEIMAAEQIGGVWSSYRPVTRPASTATSAVVTGLTNGRIHIFVVRAVNAAGSSPWITLARVVTPAAPPAAVSALAAMPGNRQVALSWSAPADNGGAPITNYEIMAAEQIGGVWSSYRPVTRPASTATSAVVTGLTNGRIHIFVVRAVNAAGSSPWITLARVVTPAAPPAAVSALAAMPGNRQVALSWSAPADNGGAPITNYEIMAAEQIGGVWSSYRPVTRPASTATSAVVTGLTNGRIHIFVVRAVNAAGSSPWTTLAKVVTPRA